MSDPHTTDPYQNSGQPEGSGQAAQPPEPKKKSWFRRHKVLTGIGAVVLVAAISSAMGGDDEDTDTASASTEDTADTSTTAAADSAEDSDEEADTDDDEDEADQVAEEAESAPGLGDVVRDGDFEFVVTEIESGVERLGDDFLSTEPQGQFALAHMTVTNISDSSQSFFSSDQNLVDSEGRSHSSDSGASLYLDDAASFDQINPGNSVEGIVVFDIPVDAVPAALELHDSMFSGGITVTLD